MGTAIPSWSVCGDAERVVRGSGCHRARDGDQDTLSEHKKDGTRTRHLEYEPFRGPRMAVRSEWRYPRRWCPGDVLLENKVARTYLRRADFEQWGLSEGCPGCRYLRTGQERQQAHSEACQRRIEGLLKGDPLGSARLAAADEGINRALAHAVERHATEDPQSERPTEEEPVSSVTPSQSVSHKRIALDTEQDPTPQPRVSIRGISRHQLSPTRAPARAT